MSVSPWYRDDNEISFQLIQRFIVQAPQLFFEKFVCYNLHAAYHVPRQALRHGPVYRYSAYIMENHYRHMKHYLAKNDLPLSQLVKRIYERWNAQHSVASQCVSPIAYSAAIEVREAERISSSYSIIVSGGRTALLAVIHGQRT